MVFGSSPSRENSVDKNKRSYVYKNPGTNTVQINGECLEYEATRKYVIHNQKNKRYGIYLGLGHNGYIHVRPIKKTGELVHGDPFWTHDGNWYFVGTIQPYVAFRPAKPSETWLSKFLDKILPYDGRVQVCTWVEDIELWPKDRHLPAGAPWLLGMRAEQERETS
jgi:hypothetical protein